MDRRNFTVPPTVVIRRAPGRAEKSALEAPGKPGLVARLARLRERGDVTLKEQDRLAGLTLNHSSNIQSAKGGKYISARTVAALAQVYGTTMEYLYLGVGQEPSLEDLKYAISRAHAEYEALAEKINSLKAASRGGL